MTLTLRDFSIDDLRGDPRAKTALLINPPVYDTQYWAAVVAALRPAAHRRAPEKRGYKRRALFDFMEPPATSARCRSTASTPAKRTTRGHCPRPVRPSPSTKKGSRSINKYHFGRTWPQFEAWLDRAGL